MVGACVVILCAFLEGAGAPTIARQHVASAVYRYRVVFSAAELLSLGGWSTSSAELLWLALVY